MHIINCFSGTGSGSYCRGEAAQLSCSHQPAAAMHHRGRRSATVDIQMRNATALAVTFFLLFGEPRYFNFIIIIMGNQQGSISRLGISALASTTPAIEKDNLLELRTVFLSQLARIDKMEVGHELDITREMLFEATAQVKVFEDPDNQLFEHMFTLLDVHGENAVSYKELLVGISLISSGTAGDIASTAFLLYDTEGQGQFLRADVLLVLSTMNTIASYFGDPVLSAAEIDRVVADCMGDARFTDQTTLLSKLTSHVFFLSFVEGKGSVRYANQMQ